MLNEACACLGVYTRMDKCEPTKYMSSSRASINYLIEIATESVAVWFVTHGCERVCWGSACPRVADIQNVDTADLFS